MGAYMLVQALDVGDGWYAHRGFPGLSARKPIRACSSMTTRLAMLGVLSLVRPRGSPGHSPGNRDETCNTVLLCVTSFRTATLVRPQGFEPRTDRI